MRLLILSSSGIYNKQYRDTKKNCSGFGLMVNEIAYVLSEINDTTFISTQSNINKKRVIGNAFLVKKSIFDLFFYLKPCYFWKIIQSFFIKNISLKEKIRLAYNYMNGSFCEHIIKKERIEVVQINGMISSTLPYLYACSRMKVPLFVTLHGLNSFSSDININSFSKNIERNFLALLNKKQHLIVTVISTGIKRRIENYLNTECLKNVIVINNPLIPFSKSKSNKENSPDSITFACIGNISQNKNQDLLIQSFAELKTKTSAKIRLFIIGDDPNHLLEQKYKHVEGVVFFGLLPRDEIGEMLSNSIDYIVVSSKEEGFGMTAIEGYSFGLPAILSNSIDALDDISNDDVSVVVESYSIIGFRDAMIKAMNKRWNKEIIIKFSRRFDRTFCGKEYYRVAQSTFCNSENATLTKDDFIFMERNNAQ